VTTKHRSVGGFCYGEPTPWDRRWSGVSLRRLVTLSALIAVLIAAGCKGGGSGSGGGGSSQITGIFFSGPTSVALGSSIQLTIVADVAGGGTDSDTNDFNGSLTPSFVNSNPLAASVTPVNSPDSILLSVGGLSAGQSTMITETLVVNGTTTFTAHTTITVTAGGGGNARTQTTGQANTSATTSLSPAISTDTRYVAFVAPVPDPTTDASTGTDNVYVRDTCTGAPTGCTPSTTLISVAADGSAADGASELPSMSANGRYVTFVSLADNLVEGGSSGLGDIFVRDTCAGAPANCTPSTSLISVASDGSFENGPSDSPSISANGQYVVFSSLATNLVPGTTTTSAEPDIYLRDLCVGAPAGCQASTIQLSVSSSTTPSP